EHIAQAAQLAQLEEVRRSLLGKKGELKQLLRGLGAVPAAERPRIGQLVNDANERIEALLQNRQEELAMAARNAQLAGETIDVTLPPPERPFGRRHPLTQTCDDIIRIFSNLGYSVVEGPEVETVYYNFDALNIGPDHPAR